MQCVLIAAVKAEDIANKRLSRFAAAQPLSQSNVRQRNKPTPTPTSNQTKMHEKRRDDKPAQKREQILIAAPNREKVDSPTLTSNQTKIHENRRDDKPAQRREQILKAAQSREKVDSKVTNQLESQRKDPPIKSVQVTENKSSPKPVKDVIGAKISQKYEPPKLSPEEEMLALLSQVLDCNVVSNILRCY